MVVELKPAIGHINTIEYTNKTNYVMGLDAVDYPILIFHGATGNGKSMLSTLKFFTRVFKSPHWQQTFVLAGRDITALERRFVKSNQSVFNWHPFIKSWEYKKQGIGGATIIVTTRTGKKNIYLTPFNNVSAYSRILGETINGVLVDEAVEADEMFLQEIVARINRTRGSWGIFTSNGGDPNHFFYTHMINRSIRIEELVDDVISTPEAEIRYYDDVRDEKMLTVHMGLEDNPVYDKEQLEKFYNMYPSGSFMYNSRILGVRGFTQNAPFSPYMNEDIFVKLEDLRDRDMYPAHIVFSVDVGGHVFDNTKLKINEDLFGKWYNQYNKDDYGTTNGGHTVMITGGFSRDYTKFVLIDTYFPNDMQDHINVERIYERVYNISTKFPRVRKPYMFCDPASPSMLSGLMQRRSGVGSVRKAIKRDTSINLDEKVIIAMIQQYMMTGNYVILDTPSNRTFFYDSMVQATLEADGTLLDNKKEEADIQDGHKYIFSSMYRALV